MDTNNIAKIVLSLIVAIVLACAILIPTVQAAEYTQVEQDEDLYDYKATNVIGDYTYDFSSDGITFNGTFLGNATVTMLSDCAKIQYYNGSATLFDKTAGQVSITQFQLNADGSYSYTSGDTETTSENTIMEFIGVATSGDYVANGSNTARVMVINPDDVIYVSPISTISGNNSSKYITMISGTYDELTMSAAYLYANNTWGATTGTFAINNYTENDDGTISINGNGGTMTIGTISGNSNYGLFVPAEYVTKNLGAEYDLIGIIPLLVFVGIVLGAVGALMRRD